MSHSKAPLFPLEDQKTAHLAKAIGHPARIAILRLMARYRYVEHGFLVAQLPLASPTIQQHLNYLAERDVISIDIEPAKARYAVNWSGLEGLQEILHTCLDDVCTGRNNP